MLVRFSRYEALRELARTAKPLDDQIVRCLSLFDKAESEVALRPFIFQAIAAFREASSRRRNTQPWLLLFDHLGAERNQSSDDTFSVVLQSESSALGHHKAARLEILLSISSFSDPPVKLDLEIGGDSSTSIAILSEDDYLPSKKLVAIEIPEHLIDIGDQPTILPYRLTGRTLRGRTVDQSCSLGSQAHAGEI